MYMTVVLNKVNLVMFFFEYGLRGFALDASMCVRWRWVSSESGLKGTARDASSLKPARGHVPIG